MIEMIFTTMYKDCQKQLFNKNWIGGGIKKNKITLSSVIMS